jgi:hypothetical protein
MPKKKQNEEKVVKKSKKDSATVDKKIKKQIIQEAKADLEKAAEKEAKKLLAMTKLETQIELSDIEKDAARYRALGFTIEEVSEKTGLSLTAIADLHKLPHWVSAMQEMTLKEGFSDRAERVRGANRLFTSLQETLVKKVAEGKLDDLSVAQLMDMLLKMGTRLDSLADKKEDGTGKRDITVLILNHQKENSGKDYKNLKEMFKEDMEMFPVIDGDYEVVEDEE